MVMAQTWIEAPRACPRSLLGLVSLDCDHWRCQCGATSWPVACQPDTWPAATTVRPAASGRRAERTAVSWWNGASAQSVLVVLDRDASSVLEAKTECELGLVTS